LSEVYDKELVCVMVSHGLMKSLELFVRLFIAHKVGIFRSFPRSVLYFISDPEVKSVGLISSGNRTKSSEGYSTSEYIFRLGHGICLPSSPLVTLDGL
jgi:hypothetical protein